MDIIEKNYIYTQTNVNDKNDSVSFGSARELFLYEYITAKIELSELIEDTKFQNKDEMLEELGTALIPSDFINYELLDNIFDSIIEKYKIKQA